MIRTSNDERVAYINEHRLALDYEPFTQLTDDEIEHYLLLIERYAPYANDPFDPNNH